MVGSDELQARKGGGILHNLQIISIVYVDVLQ